MDSLHRRGRFIRQESCYKGLSYSSRFVFGHIYCRDTDQEAFPTQASIHLNRPRHCRRAQTRELFVSIGT